MIIILEGPEGAGKTTLASMLADMLSFPYIHRSKPKDEKEKQEMYESYLQAVYSGQNAIFDRCWYSEIVYGRIMRDQSYITVEQMHELESALAKNGGGIIIHCTDDEDLLWKRSQERGEGYITEYGKLVTIKHEYEWLMHKVQHKIPVMRYELSKSL